MAIPALPPIGAGGVGGVGGIGAGAQRPAGPAPAGFGDALKRGLQEVSSLEQQADAVSTSLASGGPAKVHDLMVATTKASVGVDLLVQVRNRAVEAYQEIMRMQV